MRYFARGLTMACVLFLAMASMSHAREFSRFAQSGVTKPMYTYHSWNEDCTNKGGVIRVVAKPKHGTVKSQASTSPPYSSNHKCYRIDMEGFRVLYTSNPGYRGPDNFVLEVIFPGQPRSVDRFMVDVK